MLYHIQIKTTNPERIKTLLADDQEIYDGSGCGHWANFKRACADAVLYNDGVETATDGLLSVYDQHRQILVDRLYPTKDICITRINQLKNPNKQQRWINHITPSLSENQLKLLYQALKEIKGKAEVVSFDLEDDF